MDFNWAPEQWELYTKTVSFAKKALNQGFHEREAKHEFFTQGWQACAQYGILGLFVPEQYGGSGLDPLSTALVLEGLGYGCEDMGLLFSISAHMFACMSPIWHYGSEFQKNKYLAGLVHGTWLGANCMSESSAGSDVFSISTMAIREGDHYLLTGSKSFTTNGPIADIFLVYATTGKEKGVLGITPFIVEKKFPGISCSTNHQKIGLSTSPIGDVYFDHCRVPMENRVGKDGEGASIFSYSMEWERSCLFACYLGFMERQLELCIQHTKNRKQFGKSISKFNAVAHKVVDMKIRLDASKLLLYKAVSKLNSPKPNLLDSAIAKTFVSEAAVKSSLDAIQLHGAYGIMVEAGIERYLRDAIPSTIFSGTSEIQRNIIARCLKL